MIERNDAHGLAPARAGGTRRGCFSAACSHSLRRPVRGSGSASASRWWSGRRPITTRRRPTTIRRRPIIRRRQHYYGAPPAYYGAPSSRPIRRPGAQRTRRQEPVLPGGGRRVPDGTPRDLRLVLLLHHGAGTRLGPRHLMAGAAGARARRTRPPRRVRPQPEPAATGKDSTLRRDPTSRRPRRPATRRGSRTTR